MSAAVPYEEPSITAILVLASFLLLANVLNFVLDRLLFCGLIGQILVGVAWGVPGGNFLSNDVQHAIVQFGYLGLIAIVYEGGLSINIRAVKSNLFLSSLVALIGISAPIALTFAVLEGLLLPTISPKQAFAAGAALCSTSLGTTFTVLSTSGLNESRLATVLTSAAMMDDVVGLVMTQVIASLGSQASDFSAVTVIRPVFTAIAFATIAPLLCVLVAKPLTQKYLSDSLVIRSANESSLLCRAMHSARARFVLHVLVLIALVTGTSYAGTSNLLGAYVAGAIISWWDGLCEDICAQSEQVKNEQIQEENVDAHAVRATSILEHQHCDTSQIDTSPGFPHKLPAQQEISKNRKRCVEASSTSHEDEIAETHLSGTEIYEIYFTPAVQSILKPFFFASIGFSIPISQMFQGRTFWRGIVYAIFMAVGKLLCGLCLIRFHVTLTTPRRILALLKPSKWRKLPQSTMTWLATCWPRATQRKGAQKRTASSQDPTNKTSQPCELSSRLSTTSIAETTSPSHLPPQTSKPLAPQSLYPAAILGSAMVARGEIGFLISSVAESDGVFSSDGNQQLYLVVTWAILICTFFSPVTVGLLVRRVRALQTADRQSGQRSGRPDPLGNWGVVQVN